jgi:putative NIF3 family GTP cyclohydrolase 1 type 2
VSERGRLSRREFAALAAVVPFALARPVSGAALTAQDVVERIKKNLGLDWKPDTVDAIKAGDTATPVTGIVTTSLATVAVLQRALKAGANLVVTSGPTFYSRSDSRTPPAGRGATDPPPSDPVFSAKNELIEKHRLVIFRLRDHWRARKPDPVVHGLGTALGWSKYQAAGDPSRYEIPATSLDALASHVKKALGARGGLRVIGDPTSKVQKIALLPGSTPIGASLEALPGVDAIVAGEVREWESTEYARDTVFSGRKKGLILVGRILSEEPGMNACASWLKTFVPEVSVQHIAAGDPYWRPE